MPPRNRRRAAAGTSRTGPTGRDLNEAARITARLQQAGLTKADIARILGRDPSLISQFATRNKGAAFVPALTQIERAVAGGISDREELAAIAAPHITRRTTASGSRARVRTKAVLITPAGTGTGRAGAQAIASGSARLRPLIAEAARLGLRLAFTVRVAKTGYIHPSGSRTDSPGIRRSVIQRADHTEERSYGSAHTGGFDAAEFAARVDAAGGDVTAAVHAFLVETGRVHPSARIIHLEIRTWRAR
ncbi:helix-turn-helix domain containing protein [Actinacidiphila epipremni]|uniref:helix-turn-helix domain containing protein n=1 Tax=Actinacidiphila epipremni TaxID=2053013 RepID=UPI001F1184A2|nr:helix-turn-helix domain containing protein [Actinacidiphila epipremni]